MARPRVFGSDAPAHALNFDGLDDADAQIGRKGLRHEGWPPSPALSVNHDLPIQGNPQSDSVRSENALAGIWPIGDATSKGRRSRFVEDAGKQGVDVLQMVVEVEEGL